MARRYCNNCGKDITLRPSHHYLCYSCWLTRSYKPSPSIIDDLDYGNKYGYNDTYEQFYKGDPEYDIGPDWDYDEYPPENL